MNGIVDTSLDLIPQTAENSTVTKKYYVASLIVGISFPAIVYISFGVVVLLCYLCVNGCCGNSCCSMINYCFTFVGGLLYFIGESLQQISEQYPDHTPQNGRTASNVLLIFALVFYRFIPTVLPFTYRKLQGHCHTSNNVRESQSREWDSLTITVISILGMSVDLDTIFTLFEINDTKNRNCSASDPDINGQWIVIPLEVGIFPVICLIVACVQLYDMFFHKYSDAQKHVMQPWKTRTTCICDVITGFTMSFIAMIAVECFIIAHHDQPLDCTTKNERTNRITRLTLLSFSLATLISMLISVYTCRCCFVSVEDIEDEVNVEDIEEDERQRLLASRNVNY